MSILVFDLDMESCATIQARIDKIQTLITSLLDTAVRSVARGDKAEYSIDTTQSKERVVFTKLEDVYKAIEKYEGLITMYQFKQTGRQFRNIDARNLRQ